MSVAVQCMWYPRDVYRVLLCIYLGLLLLFLFVTNTACFVFIFSVHYENIVLHLDA